jgi:hypothetical protein
MNWKGRQMFGGRPSGIVQMMGGGMTPYPTHVMPDGTVMPGATHGAGYEIGGMVGTELFEEGDSDINNALNTMASVSNPEVPDMPASNGMALPSGEMVAEEMTMDQGSGYEEDVMQLKDQFKNEIRSYVSQAGTTDIGQYLKNIRVAYNNQLNKIKEKHNVTETFPSDELITEDFLAELSSGSEMPNELPGYDNGGEVELTQEELDAMFGPGRMPLENWKKKSDRVKRELKNKAMLVRLAQPQTQTTSAGLDRSALDALMQERRENAKRLGAAARAGYSSTQSRLLHHDSAKKAGEAAEAMAMDKIIADQISQEQSLLGAQARATGKGIGGLDFDFSTAESESITIGDQVRKAEQNEALMDRWDTLINNQKISGGKYEQAMEIWMSQYGAPPPGLTNFQSKRNFIKQSGPDKGKKVSASFAAFYKDLVQSGANQTAIKKAIKAWVSYPIT